MVEKSLKEFFTKYSSHLPSPFPYFLKCFTYFIIIIAIYVMEGNMTNNSQERCENFVM